eukprot:3243632-Amphidinium_carterae.1
MLISCPCEPDIKSLIQCASQCMPESTLSALTRTLAQASNPVSEVSVVNNHSESKGDVKYQSDHSECDQIGHHCYYEEATMKGTKAGYSPGPRQSPDDCGETKCQGFPSTEVPGRQ